MQYIYERIMLNETDNCDALVSKKKRKSGYFSGYNGHQLTIKALNSSRICGTSKVSPFFTIVIKEKKNSMTAT